METFGTMARRWRGGLTQVEAYGISHEELGDAVRLLGQLETADEVDE